MGSTISSNNYGGLERRKSKRYHNKKQGKRRDSVNRPVLKLQICSNSMERQHRVNGVTSLDHPFLERLNGGDKYGAVDAIRDPTVDHVNSSFTTLNDVTLTAGSDGRHSAAIGIRSASIKKTTIPRSASTGYERPSSPSLITLQFVDNGQSTSSLATTADCDHLCLVQYGRKESFVKTERVRSPNLFTNGSSCDSDNGSFKKGISSSVVDYSELPLVTKRYEQQSQEQQHGRAYSMDDLSKPKLCHRTSVRISRKITHTTSLHDDLDDVGDIEVILNKDDWSFGENIMRCLEDEGIVLFNIEEPRTLSEREVDATWPELKNKMKRWRSEQSLLEL